jgi:hypothetical protein
VVPCDGEAWIRIAVEFENSEGMLAFADVFSLTPFRIESVTIFCI